MTQLNPTDYAALFTEALAADSRQAFVSALVSQDDTRDAAYLRLCFFWTLGGDRCWVDCEVSNVGVTGCPVINLIPTITRKED